ncbi:MAG: serine/threonine protein kinase [Labilithrix sp.]|nr:serine/threonine protein kinase [Labilithrix sp.]MCW5814521.1 serine/threonine protein kinase [Labilithrix sp.]
MAAEPAIETSGDNSPLLREGELVGGRYRVEHCLGGGGMASVYRAMHEGLDRPVALKVVSPAVRELPGIALRFMREARAATRLKSEHVVRVFDVGTTDRGAPYLVMELLEGKDLSEMLEDGKALENGKALSVADAIDYALQACEALAEVHGLGIVHRDLKPANLFVTRGADGMPCLKLIDFGISRIDAPLSPKDAIALTSPEVVMGSPRYMPPEQMESAAAVDSRSDIWGLGAILYEMLVGDAPFDGESLMDIYAAAVRAAPKLPSAARADVPEALDAVILRCLAADPNERFADVAELAAALAPLGDERAPMRASAIARVLGATRARGQGSAAPDPVDPSAGSTPSSSHIRERATPSQTTRHRRRTLALGAAAILLVGVGLGAKPLADRFDSPAALPPTLTSAPLPPVEPPAEPFGPPAPTHTTKPSAPEPAPPPWRPPPKRADDQSLFEERK